MKMNLLKDIFGPKNNSDSKLHSEPNKRIRNYPRTQENHNDHLFHRFYLANWVFFDLSVSSEF